MNQKQLQDFKSILLNLFLALAAAFFSSCDDDDKPKTVPELSTGMITDVTTTSATVSGEIINDGNSSVTVSGFVYSSVIGVPTLADDKIELTDTEGDFSAVLTSLSSGTTYHVRAYATNNVGTGYGEVVDFTTGNGAPIATGVAIAGTVQANTEVTATYTYNDAESDAESGTTFQWYVATDAAGTGEAAIPGETSNTYTIHEDDQGKFIRVGVTPRSAAGTINGIEVKSSLVGPVGEATTVTFMYNGEEVTYGILVSPTTGEKWLDRNLGASNVPSAFDDYANYGDSFQWGRLADGHQLIVRTGLNDADALGVNGNTSLTIPYEVSAMDVPGHSKFIINGQSPSDWRVPQNDDLWQGTNGINNPCPTGWRIPTQAEWAAENMTTIDDAYSKMKITYSGFRGVADGAFSTSTSGGFYWSSTVDTSNPDSKKAVRIRFNSSGYNEFSANRGSGYACRCIKD